MNILYFGSSNDLTTSGHRANALIRIGHTLRCIDLAAMLQLKPYQSMVHYKTGFRFLQKHILSLLRELLYEINISFDLIWVDGGQYFGPSILLWVKQVYQIPIILYNVDDPTGPRDFCFNYMLRKSFSFYSLCVFVRQETAIEALALKAKKVLTVSRSFDEAAHLEQGLNCKIYHEEQTVSFIGTNIKGESRDLFLMSLVQSGFPIKIYGGLWFKSRYWKHLKSILISNQATGVDYVYAIKSSAACLGFLSHLNRDLITTRSLEIPACSGLFCAESSSEHQLLYENKIEAILWSNIDECGRVINELLADVQSRTIIRNSGTNHIKAMGVGNEDICKYVLDVLR